MAEALINTVIIGIAVIGGLYAIGLIIVAIIGPPRIEDIECTWRDDCNCDFCEAVK